MWFSDLHETKFGLKSCWLWEMKIFISSASPFFCSSSKCARMEQEGISAERPFWCIPASQYVRAGNCSCAVVLSFFSPARDWIQKNFPLLHLKYTLSPCSSNAENLPYQLCIYQCSPFQAEITFCKLQLVKITLHNEHITISADWKMWSRVLGTR